MVCFWGSGFVKSWRERLKMNIFSLDYVGGLKYNSGSRYPDENRDCFSICTAINYDKCKAFLMITFYQTTICKTRNILYHKTVENWSILTLACDAVFNL